MVLRRYLRCVKGFGCPAIILLLAATGLALLSGCFSNPVNAYTGAQYFDSGQQAEARGNLRLAAMNYSRAYGNCIAGNLGPNAEAHTLYEYARMSAYLGNTTIAEKGFQDVIVLIDKTGGELESLRAPTLCEFARMLHDSNQDKKAVPIFERAISALDLVHAEQSGPQDFSEFLDDYAASLAAANLPDKAAAVTARSKNIKESHQGEHPHLHLWRIYNYAAMEAEKRNDWKYARVCCSRAVRYAEAEDVSKKTLAVDYYEYGRSLGVLSNFNEAELYLKKALALDQEEGGQTFLDLSELARLNYAQKRFPEAIGYYESDINALKAIRADEKSPGGFTDLLIEYAHSLREVGRASDSANVEAEIAKLKARHPDMHSGTDITPYGAYPPI